MSDRRYSDEAPALPLSEVRKLLEEGASPEELLLSAGVPAEDVPEVLASIHRRAILMHPDAPWNDPVRAREEVVEELERLERGMRQVEEWDAWLRSGDPSADWGIVLLPLDFSEAERVEALRRILHRMDGPPVHRSKWRENREALLAALDDMGVRVEDLAEARGWEAVRTAIGQWTPDETKEGSDGALRRFRSSLERLILEDLLGPEWRRKVVQEGVPLDPDELDPVEDELYAYVEARAEVDALLGKAELTSGERDVLELDRQGYTTAEIAAELDRSEDAVRQSRSTGWRKLRSTLP